MDRKWSYFFYLLWLSYLITSGILMFSRGFLLTRQSQKEVSICTPYRSITCNPNIASKVAVTNGLEFSCTDNEKLSSLLKNVNESSSICLPRRSRVALIVIDAFKHEFSEYNESLAQPMYYQNKMPVIRDMLKDSPDHTRLYKFLADPPTTTLQRLKGLTTGSLPTFIDAGSNFATTEINEDNIVDQVVKHGGKAVLLGDDTWDGLYPKRWERSMALHSFNTWDLDTVDNAVNSKIFEELAEKDWSLLVAHYLGVDHCGHRYGPFHPEMERKLGEMNEMISQVIKALDNDTMLIVIGDHGMTNTGDHGGESVAEVTATMFVYSPTQLMSVPAPLNSSMVRQVDLVPTLAAILGIPNPFSNLGSLIFDALPMNKNVPYHDWQFALINLWSNVKQVYNYIKHYSKGSNDFSEDQIDVIERQFAILSERVKDLYSVGAFVSFSTDAREFIIEVRSMCQEIWIQFDSFSMSRGLLLLFITVFLNYLIIDGIPLEKIPSIIKESFLKYAYGCMGMAAAASIICHKFELVDNLEITILFSTGTISVSLLGLLVIQNWEIIAQQWHDLSKKDNQLERGAKAALTMSAGALLSNSYIIEEGSSSAFLFISLLFVVGHSAKQPKHVLPLFLVTSILIVASRSYKTCREEQGICYFNAEIPEMTSTKLLTAIVALCILVALTYLWLSSCGNLVSASSMVLRYAPILSVVCVASHWVTSWGPYKADTQSDASAKIAFGVNVSIILVTIVQPLYVYLVPKANTTVSVKNDDKIVPQLYNHIKNTFGRRKSDGKVTRDAEGLPVVCGLATVYSAVYVAVSVTVALTIALLLTANFAPAVMLMYVTGAMTLVILSIAKYNGSANIVQLMSVDVSGALLWMLLALYWFYGSGHHPALNAIRWSAAFVGTGGDFDHNAVPAALIIINTFGSHILFGIALPLLVIAPFTVYVILGKAGSGGRHDLGKGELMLYERNDLMFTSVFNLSVKYILFFAIRMFICMLAATIHCRHLMVWKIFAPKFIFEGIGLMVTMVTVMLSYLLLIRTHRCLDDFLTKVTKSS